MVKKTKASYTNVTQKKVKMFLEARVTAINAKKILYSKLSKRKGLKKCFAAI